MKKMGIAEKSGDSNKNEKTQQGSLRNVVEIGSKETVKSFPTPKIQNLDNREGNKGKKNTIEKKLIKGSIFIYFFIFFINFRY